MSPREPVFRPNQEVCFDVTQAAPLYDYAPPLRPSPRWQKGKIRWDWHPSSPKADIQAVGVNPETGEDEAGRYGVPLTAMRPCEPDGTCREAYPDSN